MGDLRSKLRLRHSSGPDQLGKAEEATRVELQLPFREDRAKQCSDPRVRGKSQQTREALLSENLSEECLASMTVINPR